MTNFSGVGLNSRSAALQVGPIGQVQVVEQGFVVIVQHLGIDAASAGRPLPEQHKSNRI